MKGKYEVNLFYGIPVVTDNSGQYQLKSDDNGDVKARTWRTGKHTKGQFQRPGQLMLTENNLLVLIVDFEPMAFKDRHSEVPMQRFTTEFVPDELLAQAQQVL